MNHKTITTDRRRFLLGAGAVAGVGMLSIEASAQTAAAEAETTNAKVVMDACNAIGALDIDKLSSLLHDNIVFQLFDGQPLIEGKETFLAFFRDFTAPYATARFDVHRSHVLGNLVINHRSDYFFAKEGGQDQLFEVTGFCVVRNGLIHEWRDYGLPA